MSKAMTGWGGSLTIGSATVRVRSVTITRQASEFNMTAHGDTKIVSGPGRVKRGGTFEAYVGSDGGMIAAIETPSMQTPASLTFTDSGGTATTFPIVITGADQVHGSEDAAMFTVSFTETVAIA
jgi:hypothetical protein